MRAAILASLEARDLTVTDLDAVLRELLGITFVLDGPNGVEPVVVDDTDLLLDALAAMR